MERNLIPIDHITWHLTRYDKEDNCEVRIYYTNFEGRYHSEL